MELIGSVEAAQGLIGAAFSLAVWLRDICAASLEACATCACESGNCAGPGEFGAGSTGAGVSGAGGRGGPADPYGSGTSSREAYESAYTGLGVSAAIEAAGQVATTAAGRAAAGVAGVGVTALSGGAELVKGARTIQESGGLYGGTSQSGRWVRQYVLSNEP